MPESITSLVQTATALVNAGQWTEAEKIWRQIHQREPENSQALFGLGFHAFQRRDYTAARQWLQSTVRLAPNDQLAHVTLASVHRAVGDTEAERDAIEAALVADPYSLPALLLKADWFDRAGKPAAAATVYRHALTVAGPQGQWPEGVRAQLQRGANKVQSLADQRAAYIVERTAKLQNALPIYEQSRWREAADILTHRSRPYHSQCNQLQVPRLPAIPFWDREQFPWLSILEAGTAVIQQELQALLTEGEAGFTPYIAYAPGEPVNQWAALNHSKNWNAFHLWRSGQPVAENIARCPKTAALLQQVQLAEIGGLCPNVMFSVLAPRTHIPPHHGETNARLVAHLPLVVPDGCLLRVGYEQRSWAVGECLIFDDSIEHEAVNNSDDVRVVLIFDLWNPLLSADERRLVQAMTAAMREFAE